MDKSVFLEDLDAFAYREVLSSGEAIVLIPVGSLEQHGPHLPLGTDTLLSSRFAEGVARRLGALVAQPIAYGYKSQQKSGGGNHLSGTTSLDGATLIGVARNLVKSFLNQGVRHVVFVNGHFENYQFLYEGIDLALEDLGVKPGAEQSVLLLSYWDFVSQDTLVEVYPDGFPGWEIEHGGVLETSLMLHLEPARVGMDRLVDGPPQSCRASTGSLWFLNAHRPQAASPRLPGPVLPRANCCTGRLSKIWPWTWPAS